MQQLRLQLLTAAVGAHPSAAAWSRWHRSAAVPCAPTALIKDKAGCSAVFSIKMVRSPTTTGHVVHLACCRLRTPLHRCKLPICDVKIVHGESKPTFVQNMNFPTLSSDLRLSSPASCHALSTEPHLIWLLLVSATNTLSPSGPTASPPGSENCTSPLPAPSLSPGLPSPHSVLIVFVAGSSTCSIIHFPDDASFPLHVPDGISLQVADA